MQPYELTSSQNLVPTVVHSTTFFVAAPSYSHGHWFSTATVSDGVNVCYFLVFDAFQVKHLP